MAKIRLALIGCGHVAGLHAPRLKANPAIELVACCDVSKDVVDRWIDKHWHDQTLRPQAFDDTTRMYRAVRPDAVIIATPHTAHFPQGMEALAAGCHVLMEKPMTTDSSHARLLAEEVARSGRIFVVGYNTPCTPRFAYVRDVIRKQTFGRLEMVSGYLAQNWCRYSNGTWRQDPALSGGGQSYDSGAHLLTSLCWSVESDIEEVYAIVDRKHLAVDVNSCLCARFKNGVAASLIINGNCPVDHGALSFFFDNGKIDVDGWYAQWIRCWHGSHEVQPDLPDCNTTPVDNFIDAILGRDEPRTSVREGIAHCELVEAMLESSATGMPARPRQARQTASAPAC